MNDLLQTKLLELNKVLESGVLTQKEFDFEKAALLTEWRASKNNEPEITTETGTVIGLLKGTIIATPRSQFKLLNCIDGGTYGQIWKAEDLLAKKQKTGLTTKVLKFPGNEHFAQIGIREQLSQLFEQEANIGRELNHSSIVNIMWFDHFSEWPFIVMEYLKGETLDKLIKKKGKISLSDSLAILKPIAEGLDHAHKKHIIHSDIKPANIIITDQGAKLLDFGLASQIRATTGMLKNEENDPFKGTLVYAAPEVYNPQKKADAKQDIYALACILYEMITGKPPFTEQQAKNRQEKHPAKAPDFLHKSIWNALAQGLEIKPVKRTSTAIMLLDNIEKTAKQVKLDSYDEPDFGGFDDEIEITQEGESPLTAAPASEDATTGNEQEDILQEADVYIVYGLYDQAESELKRAIDADPNNLSYRSKLLENYKAAGNKEAFEDEAKEFMALNVEGKDKYLGDITEWGKTLLHGNSLFDGSDNGSESSDSGSSLKTAAVAAGAAGVAMLAGKALADNNEADLDNNFDLDIANLNLDLDTSDIERIMPQDNAYKKQVTDVAEDVTKKVESLDEKLNKY